MSNPARRLTRTALLLSLLPAALLPAQQAITGPWQMQTNHTTAGLRGIHAVNARIAWASGTNGTVLHTTDGGQHWQRCTTPPDAAKLDFRGVWAWDAKTAIVMSSGPGSLSRLYKTTDACAHWKLLFTNHDKDGFWDALVFRSGPIAQVDGWILGDPVNGEFQLWHTENGGMNWILEHKKAPRAEPDAQGAFAASNSSMSVIPKMHPVFGSGGTAGAFVYKPESTTVCMDDCLEVNLPGHYNQWSKVPVPLASGAPSSGIFSLAFRNLQHGIAVGGDYTKPNDPTGTAAWTADGGEHWIAAKIPPHGYRSAVAWDAAAKAWIAAGTNGSDISYDDGKTWQPLDNGNWNALSLPWVVGPNGRIVRLDSHLLPAR